MTKLLLKAFHFAESGSAAPTVFVTLRTIFVATGPWIPMRNAEGPRPYYHKQEPQLGSTPLELFILLAENCDTFKFTLQLHPGRQIRDTTTSPPIHSQFATALKYSCPQLQKLILSSVSDALLPLISEVLSSDDHCLRSLEHIELPHGWQEGSLNAIRNMRQTMPNLRALILQGDNSFYLEICEELSKMTNLTHLEIRVARNTFTDDCLLRLSPLKNLRKVNFAFSTQLTYRSSPALQNMNLLQSLNLFKCSAVLGDDFEVLALLPHLNHLVIVGHTEEGKELTTKRLHSIVESCPLLGTLRLNNAVLKLDSDSDLLALSKLNHLTDLDISEVKFSDDHIRALGLCSHLKRLDVNEADGGYAAEVFVTEVSKLDKLEAINYCRSTKIDDETFRLFVESKSAALRNIDCVRIFTAEKVTDLAFSKYIIHLPNVKQVIFKESASITDDAIQLLFEQLPKLLYVNLQGLSKVTKKSLSNFFEKVKRDAEDVASGRKSSRRCLENFFVINCGVDTGDDAATRKDANELNAQIKAMNLIWKPAVVVH